MSPKQRFNITLEPAQIEFLRILEKATGASASEHIRRAVTAYVNAQVGELEPEYRAEIEKRRKQAARKKLQK